MDKVASVKGTRDFYPEQMAVRNWVFDAWRAASLRNGFEEYDAPIFEYLQLYTQKSGEEIAGQLFSLTDRGGRELAIRPEITPTLARMVNQQINALARPIKWFSIPRLCRAERPQKGRLREFFQWNVDIIGSDEVLADAECIYTAVDFLRSVGLKDNDIVVKLSSRSMLAALLLSQGFAPEQLDTVYVLLDKRAKVPEDKFGEMAAEQIPDAALRDKLLTLQAVQSLEEVEKLCDSDQAQAALSQLSDLFNCLNTMGIAAFCQFDITIVRGLAYYTGPVYEIFDCTAELRALAGGGRYDNLLSGLGGSQVPATGFGMGDVVLQILLEEKGLIASKNNNLDAFVIATDKSLFDQSLQLTGALRQKGFKVDLSYKQSGLGKQLKQPAAQRAASVLILGEETLNENKVTIKNMASGEQKTVSLDTVLEKGLF